MYVHRTQLEVDLCVCFSKMHKLLLICTLMAVVVAMSSARALYYPQQPGGLNSYYQTYNYDPYYNNGVGYVQGYGNYGGGGVMLNSYVPAVSY